MMVPAISPARSQVLLEADHQPLDPLAGLFAEEVDPSDLPEAHEEVLDNDVLLPAGGEVVRLNQDLVIRDGEGKHV